MYFVQLQRRLLENLRLRVNNGEVTERSLARLVGVSQPHIHNVLKGIRILSPESCDRIMERLDMSILDLVDTEAVTGYLNDRRDDGRASSLVRILDGSLGPGCGWPTSASGVKRFAIASQEVRAMTYPVAGRLADDPRMRSVFSTGDWVILNQDVRCRAQVEAGAHYLVKIGTDALIRRVRLQGGALYILSEAPAGSDNPQRVPISGAEILHIVRARVRFVPPAADWHATAEDHLRAPATSR